MTGKTIKDLDSEFSVFKDEFKGMKSKLSSLLQLCQQLQGKPASENFVFKCERCEKEFESVGELRKHKRTHSTEPESVRCDHCEKIFDAGWKLRAHSDIHKRYSCETCSKTFKTMDVKMKHEKISHEGLQLFCHHFNNQKTCLFASERVFLHQEAGLCKYGARCVRINCMFKHIILEYSDEDSDDDNDSEGDDDEEERDENEDDVYAQSENNVMEGEDVVTVTVVEHSANETIESVELTVYLECKDYWLSKDQIYYTEQINKFSEIERVDNLWINTKPNYNVGTYLQANLKFRTKFANQFRNDETFRICKPIKK